MTIDANLLTGLEYGFGVGIVIGLVIGVMFIVVMGKHE